MSVPGCLNLGLRMPGPSVRQMSGSVLILNVGGARVVVVDSLLSRLHPTLVMGLKGGVKLSDHHWLCERRQSSCVSLLSLLKWRNSQYCTKNLLGRVWVAWLYSLYCNSSSLFHWGPTPPPLLVQVVWPHGRAGLWLRSAPLEPQ